MNGFAAILFLIAIACCLPGWVLSRPLNSQTMMWRTAAAWLASAADWGFFIYWHRGHVTQPGWLRWVTLGGAFLFAFYGVALAEKVQKLREHEHRFDPEWRKS